MKAAQRNERQMVGAFDAGISHAASSPAPKPCPPQSPLSPGGILLKEIPFYEPNPYVKDRDRDARGPGVQ
jgi:hypothetical protein